MDVNDVYGFFSFPIHLFHCCLELFLWCLELLEKVELVQLEKEKKKSWLKCDRGINEMESQYLDDLREVEEFHEQDTKKRFWNEINSHLENY